MSIRSWRGLKEKQVKAKKAGKKSRDNHGILERQALSLVKYMIFNVSNEDRNSGELHDIVPRCPCSWL